MRILDNESDKPLKNITLLLTKDEATELKDDLERIIKNIKINEHVHINDLEYVRELTISLYCPNNLNHFDERSKKLILKDI
jgi:hypothetical protein